ncbi:hypothetical protein F4819DRAFT_292436 [Hypoxylon fuscum]|nr:hypothetical protein F4819DRAFT_292436 [Hypoxylon fuscum]
MTNMLQPLKSPGQMSFSNCTRLFGLMPDLLGLQPPRSESESMTSDTPDRRATSRSSRSQRGQKGRRQLPQTPITFRKGIEE